jgi:SAM-dependent methyltransferase
MGWPALATRLHASLVFDRRTRDIAQHVASLLPRNATVLDVGCGDGTIDQHIMDCRHDVSIIGIDVFVRPSTRIAVTEFDGLHIPYEAASFDAVLFIDVLHHTDHAMALLDEARRVARQAILLKDHFRDGFLAAPTLKLMDWVGNAGHGVALPYNYWCREEWEAAFRALSLMPDVLRCRLGLYPPPFSWIFGRGLHFIARLPVVPRASDTTI